MQACKDNAGNDHCNSNKDNQIENEKYPFATNQTKIRFQLFKFAINDNGRHCGDYSDDSFADSQSLQCLNSA